MSSNSTITNDDFVPGRKLLVHLSENGHGFEFECDGSTPVEAIQRSIESPSGVQFADQLLMYGKISLDPQHPLSYYKLPQDDREVFIYNKARLHADSPKPTPEIIDIPNPTIPSQSSASRDSHPLDNASDPALKALASYEKQFRYHFQCGNSFYLSSQAKFEVCKRLLREIRVQERALETARGNLEHTFKKLEKRYSEFVRCFSQQHRAHAELLGSFDRDLERLRFVKLHPAVQSEWRNCLLDLVKVDELRKWTGVCLNSQRQFESKVSKLKMGFAELKRKVDNVALGMSSAGTKDLEVSIVDRQKVLNDQKIIMQSLSKDVNTVKKLVDDCLKSDLTASLRPHDAVSALGPMYDVHEKNHLPKVQNYDNIISKLLDKCRRKKDDMNLLVHVSMQKVKSAQFSIKDLMNQLHAFEEVMGHKEKEFENLKFVTGVGHAYRACLAEVVRRKSSLKLYMGLAGQLAERLAMERDAEIRRREGFYKAWSKYIPQDILAAMGLFDSPSQCDVNMAPFDTNLLDIDVTDVDHYSPSQSQKDILATSSESYNFNKSEENPHLGELLDESVDIVGTSKMEVENARLKAELASAIALICTLNAGIGYDPFDRGEPDEILMIMKEKTAEALKSKDDYVKQLQSVLNMKQVQCSSYEKRIQELEQKLEHQYVKGQKLLPYISTVSMEEGLSSSASAFDPKLDLFVTGQTSKPEEGGDENMTDLLGIVNMQSLVPVQNLMDASMQEPRDEQQDGGQEKNQTGENSCVSTIKNTTDVVLQESKTRDNDSLLELQNALEDKENQLIETENKLKSAMEESSSLRTELEASRTLLGESQMNCVHLENCLHEAREEARTNLCAADRRASEYSSLRTTAVKMRSLFERFRSCVTAQAGLTSFADSLHSLALSLASCASEDEDDGIAEFRASVKVLADKVDLLSRHRSELLNRSTRTEAAVEEKTEQIKSLYTKLQLEKQASKEKISFIRLQVHELGCFVVNSRGHYEAIHRSSSNYYLSSESVALFTEQYAGRPPYIIGQIVHIERQTVRGQPSARSEVEANNVENTATISSDLSNPYGLQVGCEYFIVTVAMLPNTTIRSVPS